MRGRFFNRPRCRRNTALGSTPILESDMGMTQVEEVQTTNELEARSGRGSSEAEALAVSMESASLRRPLIAWGVPTPTNGPCLSGCLTEGQTVVRELRELREFSAVSLASISGVRGWQTELSTNRISTEWTTLCHEAAAVSCPVGEWNATPCGRGPRFLGLPVTTVPRFISGQFADSNS